MSFTLAARIAAVLLAGAPIAAQAQAQHGDSSEIVVQSQRPMDAPEARHFVRQISSSAGGQLIRFSEPVCPKVIGFDDPYNQIIADRIRAFAKTVGAEAAATDCRSNLYVLIADDADATVRELRDKVPQLFDGVEDKEVSRALRDGPVHAWNAVEVRNEDGQRANGGTMYVKSASIFGLPTQQAIVGSTVVISKAAAMGKTLRQIADYVAMRALVGARPPAGGAAVGTILTLFDGGTAPARATTNDENFVRAVYKTRPTLRGVYAMNRVAKQISREGKPDGQ